MKTSSRSFYWKPESCAGVLKETVPAPSVATPKPRVFSGDALFAFDGAELSAGGCQALDDLADELNGQGHAFRGVRIAGYTDRLGSHAYNQELSERRARAVREYLVTRGVASSLITARGYGESDPVKDCGDERREALIACLAPNRRVEVILR